MLELAIQQFEHYNPKINAVIHTFFDRARKEAKEDSFSGAFAGVPFLIKDLSAWAGAKLTFGSRFFRRMRSRRSEESVRRMLAAGLIPLGKTNTPEFGLLGSTALVAFVGDIRRFPSGRHFASYLGLTPREHSSGHCRRLGRITKRGKFYERSYSTDGKLFISFGEVAWGNGAPKWVGITALHGLRSADDIDACFDFFEARSLTDAEKNDPNYLDRKKLRGRWDVVSCQLSGKSLEEASFGQFVFDDGSVTIKEKTKSIETGYTLDATKEPKRLVLSGLSSRVKRPANGVYSLEGDTLVICLALKPDAPAPTKLETKEGDSQMLIKLQHASEERDVDR